MAHTDNQRAGCLESWECQAEGMSVKTEVFSHAPPSRPFPPDTALTAEACSGVWEAQLVARSPSLGKHLFL